MIPSSKIYDYILDLADRKINLYYFADWNTRQLDTCKLFSHRTSRQRKYWPVIISHDQELLNYDQYTDSNIDSQTHYNAVEHTAFLQDLNLRWVNWYNIHDRYAITHSERKSDQVAKYEYDGWITIYFWSHAILALDWYRYAQIDPSLNKIGKTYLRDFLIYSRGWQGSREYRIRFAEKIHDMGLDKFSIHRMLVWENYIKMTDYAVKDQRFAAKDIIGLSKKIEPCLSPSESSADYHAADFLDTAISVVLETNFAQTRQHLTEKILRPIALGHPFILQSSPGCLQYLKDYGFRTFDPLIDERYDQQEDAVIRQDMILQEMLRISSLPIKEKQELYAELYIIAKQNKQWFFSKEFIDMVMNEMNQNLLIGLEAAKNSAGGRRWLENITARKKKMGIEYHRQCRSTYPIAASITRLYRRRFGYGG